uniref:Poly [ADP-ribose] polymerase 12 n=1 Tax=Neogobius melanostomus TaxID=47308 RepID=A0A8C6UDR2_9GOBI
METDILKFILNNQGAADTKDLLFNLCDASTLYELISKNDKFASCSWNGTPKVVVRSRVRLCRARECPGTCGDVHLCKNFLLSGVCQFTQLRRGCLFSHDLNSVHNMKVLRECGLQTLTRPELCLLLLQSDFTLLPTICFDYNKGLGLNGQCSESCHRLHICEKYLNGDCTCFRTHDFFAPQPLKILSEKHVPEHLIPTLRSVYANKEALRRANKDGRYNSRSRGNVSGNLAKRTFSCGDLLGAVDTEMDTNGTRRFNQRQRDKTEICIYFIKGHCKYEADHCFKAHDKMPYRWEIKQSSQWTPMADNEKIEEDYCDPQNTSSTSRPPVHFDTMKCGSDEVRRLSTVNSVLEPDFIHTTDFLWYWEDECGKWYQYAAITSEHRLPSITSKQLEEMFLKNDKDVVEFTAGSQTYSLSFQDMIQTNLKYGTKRLVRRRPQFVSAAEVQSKRKRPTNSTAVPDYWDKMQTFQTGYKRVSLQSSSEEYKEIQQLFCQTMPNYNIIQIERIQNKALWEAFQLQKIHMKNNNGRKPVMEKKLFHGTDPKFVDTICATNFDWRVCGVNGTSYGQGSYFARDASYSHRYTGTSDVRLMFVSRVLIGEFTKGSPEFRRPPSKDGGHVNLFDSCVNDVENPSIFVVFEKHQIYPEYLLQYEQKQIGAVTDRNDSISRLRKLTIDALASQVKVSASDTGIVDSALAPNPTSAIAKTKPLVRQVIHSNPQARAEDWYTQELSAFAKTKSYFTHTSVEDSVPIQRPTLSNVPAKPLVKQVICPNSEARAFDWLEQELAASSFRKKTTDARAPKTYSPHMSVEDSAPVRRPTLNVTAKPLIKPALYLKPQAQAGCFTNLTQSLETQRKNLLDARISADAPRSTLTPTRSSTSYAYTLDYLRKL